MGAAHAAATVAARHPGFVFSSAGVHPHDADGFDQSAHPAEIAELVADGAMSIGECGLDFHYDNSPRAEQLNAFEAQLGLAAQLRLPVIVHTRNAEDDTLAMVLTAASAGVRGVLHCYTGSHRLAEAAIAAGWYISFSGIVTFKKWTDDDLLRLVPDDRVLVESDAPYLAPVPFRGRRNEPAWVVHTLTRVASARGTTAEQLGKTVHVNATRLFALA